MTPQVSGWHKRTTELRAFPDCATVRLTRQYLGSAGEAVEFEQLEGTLATKELNVEELPPLSVSAGAEQSQDAQYLKGSIIPDPDNSDSPKVLSFEGTHPKGTWARTLLSHIVV